MIEQGNTGWGMTVSRRFDGPSEANGAVDSLRQAGFSEDEIRVWEHKKAAASTGEDTLARTVEGLLAGGVIGGLAGFFVTIAFTWTGSERVTEETSAAAALAGAVIGAVVVAIAVTFISRRFGFSHSHHPHSGPSSVVTVMVGDREDEAKQVFDKLG